MDWQDRISVDPKVLVGKLVIKGTRLAVEFLMELMENESTHEQSLTKSYVGYLPGCTIGTALYTSLSPP